ncbi:FliM/FliN family flagellar motor C-terminal domain-containing protein [Sphingomonas sanxanigenens]|uniref:Flagellar motor switch protein FliN-like C-terminal domain-containing protein n=1 Tax=Sphingomonas sanxanigenens DSM 19645 = NX02 TaxID=1123269 RepID=W0AE61_9SPHN|nr:FliM/FliN family flagellar motor switch protein [Sphingomonas sanxanigenens]AHE54842.1 hypothetical protein NX02_15810 [Sphingomonas sanxanigenens DSM 19645 = NX02]
MDDLSPNDLHPDAPGTDHLPPRPEPEAGGTAALDARFAVPITIELDAASVPLASLQAMREGSIVPIDGEAGVIPVRILASGKPFARGSLVSVGDSYGVLIEAE